MQLRQQTQRIINTNRRRPAPVAPPIEPTPIAEEEVRTEEEILESVSTAIQENNQQRKNKPFKVGFNKNEKNKTSDN